MVPANADCQPCVVALEMSCTVALLCPASMPVDRTFAAGHITELTLHGKEQLILPSATTSAPVHPIKVGLDGPRVFRTPSIQS